MKKKKELVVNKKEKQILKTTHTRTERKRERERIIGTHVCCVCHAMVMILIACSFWPHVLRVYNTCEASAHISTACTQLDMSLGSKRSDNAVFLFLLTSSNVLLAFSNPQQMNIYKNLNKMKKKRLKHKKSYICTEKAKGSGGLGYPSTIKRHNEQCT